MNPRDGSTAARWLTDAGVAKLIAKTLRVHGTPAGEIEDARQDVYVKVLVAIKDGPAPADLEQMKALCATIAERHAISALRKATVRARDMVAECEVDELEPLTASAQQRDPVDAGRELEALAQLFREDRMPPDGVDILEGVACRCTHEEIALDLDIGANLVKWRLHQMRKAYRQRLVKLGLVRTSRPCTCSSANRGRSNRLRAAT